MRAAEQALACLGDAAQRSEILVSGLERRRLGDAADVRRLLGRPVLGVVPLMAAEARRSIDDRRPVGGPAGKVFAHLAATLAGERPAAAGGRVRRWAAAGEWRNQPGFDPALQPDTGGLGDGI